MQKKLIYTFSISIAVIAVIAACAISFGGPGVPPPMRSLSDPLKGVHYLDLPSPMHFVARDGTRLTFHAYPAAAGILRGNVVLVYPKIRVKA